MKSNMIKVLVLSATTLFAASCSSQEVESNESVFNDKCGLCHGPGELGTEVLSRRMDPDLAILANRTDLNEAFIKVVARNGLGGMPAITRGDTGDAELDKIIDYLTRNNTHE